MSRHKVPFTSTRTDGRTHTLTNGGKHPEITPQVAGLISQDTLGHVRRWRKYKLG